MPQVTKKVSVGLIVGIIIAVILILLLLMFGIKFITKKVVANETAGEEEPEDYDYGQYENDVPANDVSGDEEERVYGISDKLTEINFHRRVDYNPDLELYDAIDLTIDVKVSGYLEEKDPTSPGLPSYGERIYTFKNGKIEWTLDGSELSESELCRVTWHFSENKETDATGLALVYDSYGFDSDKPELGLRGSFEIPIEIITDIEILDEDAICQGYTENTVLTDQEVSRPALPLNIRNIDLTRREYSGSIETEYDGSDAPEGSIATLRGGTLYVPLDVPYDEGPWRVDWKVYLP